MSTLPRALGVGLTGLALVSIGAGTARRPAATAKAMTRVESDRAPHSTMPSASPSPEATCPRLTLPDDSVCVHWPDRADDDPLREAPGIDGRGAVDERWDADEVMPRRPDRPVDYGAYRYPVPCDGCVRAEDDLERSNPLGQSRRPGRPGRGGIELAVPQGTPVTLPTLEHQQGAAELIYAGPLLGASVVTRHRVLEAGDERDYIVVLGPIDFAPGLVASGAGSSDRLRSGLILGAVGNPGTPTVSHLRLQVRRVRKGVDVRGIQPPALVETAITIACDPRNILPLK